MYDLFGKYGPIRQIRLGTDTNLKTKGTAYVVYESPDDAADAMTHLNGFHLMERYIVGVFTLSNNGSEIDESLRCAFLVAVLSLFLPCISPQLVLYHHPSKQQASALAKAEIRAREQALADEKKRLGLRDD